MAAGGGAKLEKRFLHNGALMTIFLPIRLFRRKSNHKPHFANNSRPDDKKWREKWEENLKQKDPRPGFGRDEQKKDLHLPPENESLSLSATFTCWPAFRSLHRLIRRIYFRRAFISFYWFSGMPAERVHTCIFHKTSTMGRCSERSPSAKKTPHSSHKTDLKDIYDAYFFINSSFIGIVRIIFLA